LSSPVVWRLSQGVNDEVGALTLTGAGEWGASSFTPDEPEADRAFAEHVGR
jgi:hypothetical protein